MQNNQPIGMFDSGVGGLTVAHAIKQILPAEEIIYFGDTAHLPYGDKSAESVTHYSLRISDFLMEQQCKVILVACNTASAIAYDALTRHIGDRALLINVIDPVVAHVQQNNGYKKIGVIGTKGTINSGTYQKKLNHSVPETEVVSLATPLFVPMIEEGFIFDDISNAIIRSYLSNPLLKGIEALILGCTHYPIIRNQISKFYNFNIDVLDSARIVAQKLSDLLNKHTLQRTSRSREDQFFVSDYTPYFEKVSSVFFEQSIHLQKVEIW